MTEIIAPPVVDRKSIDELIEWLNTECVYLPSFQRQFVWDEEDIKEFVQSILDGIPVGVIILWKPSNVSKVDSFSKPLIGNYKGDEGYLVLDGQQRLTALLLMFNNWRISRNDETIKVNPLMYNPDSSDSRRRLTIGGRAGVDLSLILRAFSGDVGAYNKLVRSVGNNDQQINEFGRIASIIRNYRIPIYIIKTRNEEEDISLKMTEAFLKINREGVRIGNLELMLSYLGGGIGGDIPARIREIYNEFERRIGLELQPILWLTFSNFGIRPQEIKPEKFSKIINGLQQIDRKDILETINRTEKAVNVLADFLNALGIKSLQILPSQITLVPIAKFFYRSDVDELSNLSDSEIRNIEKWFIIANFRGYYSSQTNTKLGKDLEIIENSSNFPTSELIKNMRRKRIKTEIDKSDFERGLHTNVLLKAGRNYLFLLYLLLVKNDATDWAGVLIKACDFKELDRHHIFPRDFLRDNITFETDEHEKIKVNNLGNITFINKNENVRIGSSDPKDYLTGYSTDVIEKHFIPPLNDEIWEIEDIEVRYNHFLEKRLELIYTTAKKYYDFII